VRRLPIFFAVADAVVFDHDVQPASKVSAVIGAGSLIAAGAVVPQGVVAPPRSLVTGAPGRVRRELSEAEIAANRQNGEVYRRLLDIH
jgi:carbonic anhydrase/acetyltransferase-like protein (isoleucine patch superfamily)